MLRKWSLSILLVFFLLGGWVISAQAQQDTYRLNVQRTNGFGNGSQIRGNFKLDVVGPQNIKSVTYLIDGNEMAQVTTAPFSLAFQTTDYASGWHDLSAEVVTLDGLNYTTPARRFEFATAEQESSAMTHLVLPILGAVFGLIIIGFGIQWFIFRNKPHNTLPLGASRNYGLRGGGVCPNCHRPFGLHWWGLNIGLRTRFDRCDYCGKWGMIRILSNAELAAAEAAELQQAQPEKAVPQKSERERTEEMIDQSRFTE